MQGIKNELVLAQTMESSCRRWEKKCTNKSDKTVHTVENKIDSCLPKTQYLPISGLQKKNTYYRRACQTFPKEPQTYTIYMFFSPNIADQTHELLRDCKNRVSDEKTTCKIRGVQEI